jgi:hypothetical protein
VAAQGNGTDPSARDDVEEELSRPPASLVRINVRPIGSPLALGFFAFAVGIFLFGAYDVGWVPLKETSQVGLILLAFVAPLEIVAGILAFLSRDTAAATGLTMLSAVWAVNGLALLTGTPGTTSVALGLFLLALAAVLPGLAVPAFKGKPLFGVLFAASVVRFALAGVYQLTGVTTLNTVGGCLSMIVALFALYGGIALLVEDVRQRTILPLGRRGEAREWLEDERSLANQLSRVGREAGVRHQL